MLKDTFSRKMPANSSNHICFAKFPGVWSHENPHFVDSRTPPHTHTQKMEKKKKKTRISDFHTSAEVMVICGQKQACCKKKMYENRWKKKKKEREEEEEHQSKPLKVLKPKF